MPPPPPPPQTASRTCDEVPSCQRHYDIAVSKYRNYHLLFTNIPIVLVIPFVGLCLQAVSLAEKIPNDERLFLLTGYLLLFAFLWAFIFNLCIDTEQYIKRGCKPCQEKTDFHREMKKFFSNLFFNP
jgi:hypothetical protein